MLTSAWILRSACLCTVSVMALSLAVSSLGFQGAAPMGRAAPAVQMSAINVGDIGTTRPLGVWDPLGLMTKMPEKYRRWQVSARAAHSTDTSAALGSSTPAAAPLQQLNTARQQHLRQRDDASLRQKPSGRRNVERFRRCVLLPQRTLRTPLSLRAAQPASLTHCRFRIPLHNSCLCRRWRSSTAASQWPRLRT